jgi:hypothetical protein
MTQQTAVEWLLKKIENKNGKEFSSYYTEFIEQAKEMEKEQIVNAWDDGSETEYQYHVNGEFRKCSHDYYNETYNK